MQAPVGATVSIYDDLDMMAHDFCSELVALAGIRLLQGCWFGLGLTGGSTVTPFYEEMTRFPHASAIDWSRVQFFFSDERCVAPTHKDSNYRMAYEAWLKHKHIPAGVVYRMPADAEDLEEAAEKYSFLLEQELETGHQGFPIFDLLLLGLGDDGHIASLFPSTAALEETERSCVVNKVPQLNSYRMTLTLPVINNAREIWLIVCGDRKADVVARALGYAEGGDEYPISRLKPTGGKIRWWLDRDAASQIPQD